MRNLVNRIAVVTFIVLGMLILPLTLIFPEQAELIIRYVADVFKANLVWLDGLSPAAHIGMRVLLAGFGLAIFVVGLVLLVLELISFRRGTAKLRDGSGEIMLDGVVEHLAYHIDLLSDVVRVQPKVTGKGSSVQVELYVETGPDVHIPAKTVEIQQKAKQVIVEQLGLQLNGDVRVVIRPAPLPKSAPHAEAVVEVEPPAPEPIEDEREWFAAKVQEEAAVETTEETTEETEEG